MAEATQIDTSNVFKSIGATSPFKMKFRFIGLGNMGSRIVKNLMSSGHTMLLWNRSSKKSKQFEELGATILGTPSEVICNSDIIFCCVSDQTFFKDLIRDMIGNHGIPSELKRGKSFVEMNSIDLKTSLDTNEAVIYKKGHYMQAMIQGSIHEAESGNLIILASGDKKLFVDCQSVFRVIAKHSQFIGAIGSAIEMNLVLYSMKAACIAGLTEGLALASKAGLSVKDVMDVLETTSLKCPLFVEQGANIVDNNFTKNLTLKHLQKDLNLALKYSTEMDFSCPVLASVNEVFKAAKTVGFGNRDTSTLFLYAKDC